VFETVLVAHRGALTRRVVRTLQRLGTQAITVHSQVDVDALHVVEADESVLLGPAAPQDSYLDVRRVVEAARRTGAQAVHPGCSVLAEDAGLARAVQAAGLAWVGADPELLERPRPTPVAGGVGVQVLGLADGSFTAVGELTVRDRGVSRFEESVALTGRERDRVRSAALFAAAEAGLRGAGTVELDGQQVRRVVPRLQASHALVELVHGLDLVEQQLRIAAGEPVSYAEVEPAGWAVGVRVYAVDPVTGRPDPGRLTGWVEPPDVRVDAGYRKGDVVPPHYDPLLAVLTVVAPDRAQALARAREAIDAFVVEGVRTNLPLLATALGDPDRTVEERLRA